ncbi:MAG: MarR family winged helix-turn-helix transcriptional regulator [Oscillospiraceae bacterium]|jgi:DNA-binding MarR family transcriptional regulator
MDYEKYAAELLDYRIAGDRGCRLLQNNISEVSRGELPVLLYLVEEKDGACAGEISENFGVNTSRVASILNSLCKKGYVVRVPHPTDRRKIQVFVTEKGRSFATERRSEAVRHLSELLRLLGEEDALEHVRIMKRVAELSEHIAEQHIS